MLVACSDEPTGTSCLPEPGPPQVERAHSWPGGEKYFSLLPVCREDSGPSVFSSDHRRDTELQHPCAVDTWIWQNCSALI